MEISVIIPVFNRAKIVPRTLLSVRCQTHRPIHLILVDNNSADNSLAVLQAFKQAEDCAGFRVTVLSEPAAGATVARNAGAREATGEWIMFFDSDDTMDDCLLAKYAAKVDELHGDVDIVNVRDDYSISGMKSHPYYPKDNFLVNHIFHSCFSTQRYMVRKSIFDAVGGWNEALRGWNDWELGIRLLLTQPRVALITDCVPVHVLLHRQSITGDDYSSRHGWWESAIDEAERAVRASAHPAKALLLKYIEARRIALAGLYRGEGEIDMANELYGQVYNRVRADKTMRWLYPLVYRYVAAGGKGASWAIKALVK